MTRFVTFAGQTQYKPGGLTKVDANALTPIGISATGIVQMLGEATGGPPGTDGVVVVDDPALAKNIFRSGPLADAIRIAFNPSGDTRIPGGAFRVLAYKTNASLQSSIQLPGDEPEIADTSTAASTTTVITVTVGGLTPDAHIGRWLEHLTGGARRRIIANDATTLTVTPPFDVAPADLEIINILENQLTVTSADWGQHTTQVSVEFEAGTGDTFVVTLAFEDEVEQSDEIGGTSFLNLKYVGGAIDDTGPITVIDTTGLVVTMTPAGGAPTLDEWQDMTLQFSDGSQRNIASNTAATPAVITLAAGHALNATQQVDLISTTVNIRDAQTVTASITGANGAATGLTTTALPVADDLTLVFSTLGISTLRELVDYLDANTNYEATIPDGVNSDTTLLSTYDYGTRATGVGVRFDETITPSTLGTFRRDLQVLIDWINNFSTLATATRSTTGTGEGSELPLFTGGVAGTVRDVPIYLVGGARGISSNSTFQAGFDALIEARGNHAVPLIAQDLTNEGNGSTATVASVAAQLAAHVALGRGTGKNEMGGYLGFKGTLDEYVAQLNAINDTDVQITSQRMPFLNVDGTLVTNDEWSSAVAAAGMRSGVNEVGEPLTFKFIKTSGLEQDASWSPTALGDVNRILANGGLFAEAVAGGVRWVRDLTTHIKDDNIAFIDGNTRDATRFVAYDLRTFLEDRFTGLKAKPATVASIRESTAAKLAEYLTSNIIVESLDPETQSTIIPGFRRLRVFIEGNVATVRVEIFVVTGIVFILNDIYLQLPRLAA